MLLRLSKDRQYREDKCPREETDKLTGKVISSIPSTGSHEDSTLPFYLLMMDQKIPLNKLSVWVSISEDWSFLPMWRLLLIYCVFGLELGEETRAWFMGSKHWPTDIWRRCFLLESWSCGNGFFLYRIHLQVTRSPLHLRWRVISKMPYHPLR